MRALTPTSLHTKNHPPALIPVAEVNTPRSATTASPPAPAKAATWTHTDTPPACCHDSTMPTATPHPIDLPPASSSTPEDSATEISRLNNEIGRLKGEMQVILDHTIESDTRLLQFTDEIFVANTSSNDPAALVNQTAAFVAVDCGVQCELGDSHNHSEKLATVTTEDSSMQGELPGQQAAVTNLPCSEFSEVINSLKTTIEVLTAENQWLKLKLKSCGCAEPNHNQPWTEVINRKQRFQAPTQNRFDKLQLRNKPPIIQKYTEQISQKKRFPSKPSKNKNSQKSQQPSPRPKLRFETVTILGDSHTRHIAGLVGGLVDPSSSVSGVCKPGARLPDIVHWEPQTPSPVPRPRCEVLIAGTNDLAAGTQNNIYRHLEGFITTRPAGTELVIATLPQRHDLKDTDHPIHDETVLVNAFIEELAARHNLQVLNLDGISRRHFTRHGQHLSMRGKRLLAELLVKSLCLPRRRPVPPRPPRPARSTLVPPTAGAVTRPGYKTFAEAVTTFPPTISSPSPSNEHESTFLGNPLANNGLN